jgi:capsid assembly protease
MTKKRGERKMGIGNSHLISALASIPWCLRAEMFRTFETVLNNKYILGLNVTDLKNSKQDEGQLKSNPYKNMRYGSISANSSNSKPKHSALIKMHGTLLKKAYTADTESGGTRTLENVQDDLREAANDPEVGAIILDIESPGGGVPGISETARLIRDINGTKPVIGLAGGYICSGAYWIGSACQELYVSESTEVGSIGVYMAHISLQKALEEEGIKVTLIKAGKNKAVGNEFFDLSESDLNVLQGTVDKIYDVFVSGVALNRGVDKKKVINEWADARIFLGQEAVDNGLVDGIASLDEIVNSL